MNTVPVDLTIEVRSSDGTLTEFYQSDEERIGKTLRLLASPRLLIQPQLTLAGEHGVSTIPTRAIDLILARTSARSPLILPLIFPAGLLDLVEATVEPCDEDSVGLENDLNTDSTAMSPVTLQVEIHTLGGWLSTLKALAMLPATVHDQRQSFARLFDLPVIPFRLQAGGIGLINPANIARVSTHPAPTTVPETALAADLVRWKFRDSQPSSPKRIATEIKSYWAGHPVEMKAFQTT